MPSSRALGANLFPSSGTEPWPCTLPTCLPLKPPLPGTPISLRSSPTPRTTPYPTPFMKGRSGPTFGSLSALHPLPGYPTTSSRAWASAS
eukprot:7053654-Pyramimonas_sp.AAC.1